MVSYVLSQFSRIYRNEARAIQRGLSPNERLEVSSKTLTAHYGEITTLGAEKSLFEKD